jgi:hypothetical protein
MLQLRIGKLSAQSYIHIKERSLLEEEEEEEEEEELNQNAHYVLKRTWIKSVPGLNVLREYPSDAINRGQDLI